MRPIRLYHRTDNDTLSVWNCSNCGILWLSDWGRIRQQRFAMAMSSRRGAVVGDRLERDATVRVDMVEG